MAVLIQAKNVLLDALAKTQDWFVFFLFVRQRGKPGANNFDGGGKAVSGRQ